MVAQGSAAVQFGPEHIHFDLQKVAGSLHNRLMPVYLSSHRRRNSRQPFRSNQRYFHAPAILRVRDDGNDSAQREIEILAGIFTLKKNVT